MRVAFCCAEDINIGAAYIIAYLKQQGHDVRLFFDPKQGDRGYGRNKIMASLLSVENYNVAQIKKFKPDICCFSCVTATYQWALRMAYKVKFTVGCKIVFGGVHACLVPEEVRSHKFIDEVVTGCGVEYFGGKFDPDNLWPDREIFLKELPPEHRKEQLFMTSIGCPFNCTFCGNEQLRAVGRHRMIRRTPEGCIKELKHLKERGMKHVLFVDDIFTCDTVFLSDFLSLYIRDISLPYSCFIHPKFVTKEAAESLGASGCTVAWMGIQTGNEQLRKDILARHETNEEIIDAAKLIKGAGIKLMVDHIFGIPFENMLTQDLSYGLYREIKADVINCYQLLYFPKSKIIEHAVKFGYLSPAGAQQINEGKGIVYQTNNHGQKFYDIYAKGMVAIPLGSVLYELLPMSILKLIIHIRAGRIFMPIAIIQNEIYFTWQAILKKLRVK
jgi:anaerobic magnesium-protoporphyrin IX monomethyl ester cyclase